MRYASIRKLDISNGEGTGVSLFVQGCHFHCKNCFNKETWDFNGGNEWNDEKEQEFLSLVNRPYIKRVSILGGEPLEKENVLDVHILLEKIKTLFPEKKIWLYSGFTFSSIINPIVYHSEKTFYEKERYDILDFVDVFVDGQYVDELHDINLEFRGSSNQRIIRLDELRKEFDPDNYMKYFEIYCKLEQESYKEVINNLGNR